MPGIKGRLSVQDGTLRVVRPDGRQLEITRVRSTIDLDTLDRVAATLSLEPSSGQELTWKPNCKGLLRKGSHASSGPVAQYTSQPRPRSHWRLSCHSGSSRHRLAVESNSWSMPSWKRARSRPTSTAASRTAGAARQHRPGRGGGQHFSANLRATAEMLAGHVSVDGHAGTADFQAAYAARSQRSRASVERILADVLAGRPASLPKASLEGRCELDLARWLAPCRVAARPSRLGGDQRQAQRQEPQGGGREEGSAQAAIELSQLVAHDSEKTVQWEPISLSLLAAVEPGRGLNVREGNLTSGLDAFRPRQRFGSPCRHPARFDRAAPPGQSGF